MSDYAQVHLGVERLPAGPWVYGRLMDPGPQAEDGSIVEVIDGEGRFCGHGLYNSTSDIRVRMLSRGKRSELARPREFLQRRIAAALRLRRKVLRLDDVTDAYRVVHAEGDDLSGLIVDKLGDALVCQYHSLGFWRLRSDVEACLRELFEGHLVVHRFARTARKAEGFPPIPEDGSADPGAEGDEAAPRYVTEHGVRFLVAPGAGHKTGWF
ncbi:MAG: RlmI/RlmK family 23S rRNA methyltransferase, partial [Planctomycetota bacterium]